MNITSVLFTGIVPYYDLVIIVIIEQIYIIFMLCNEVAEALQSPLQQA
jgi:hypothetical protein